VADPGFHVGRGEKWKWEVKKKKREKKGHQFKSVGKIGFFSGYFFKVLVKFTNLFCYYVNYINILKKWPENI